MQRRLRGLKPSTPENSACRSRAKRQEELPAEGKGGPNLGGTDAALQVVEEFAVTGGELEAVCMATLVSLAAK
jgi:hypothetical protein